MQDQTAQNEDKKLDQQIVQKCVQILETKLNNIVVSVAFPFAWAKEYSYILDLDLILDIALLKEIEGIEGIEFSKLEGLVVKAPLRNKLVCGVIVNVISDHLKEDSVGEHEFKTDSVHAHELKSIAVVLYKIDEKVIDWLRLCQKYYMVTFGQCLRLLSIRDYSSKKYVSNLSPYYRLTDDETHFEKNKLKTVEELNALYSYATWSSMVRKKLLIPAQFLPNSNLSIDKISDPISDAIPSENLADRFTPDQKFVSKALQKHFDDQKFIKILLLGQTGSGKTEVYLDAIKHIATKKKVVILLPEILLTQGFIKRFEAKFGLQPLVYHSQISKKAKESIYAWSLDPSSYGVLVGARSALFNPFANLGCVIIDEEHDLSYKNTLCNAKHSMNTPSNMLTSKKSQLENLKLNHMKLNIGGEFLYNAKTCAEFLCQTMDCPLMLVSATASLENIYHGMDGSKGDSCEGRIDLNGIDVDGIDLKGINSPGMEIYRLERSVPYGLPKIQIIDMKKEGVSEGFLSNTALKLLKENLLNNDLLQDSSCAHAFKTHSLNLQSQADDQISHTNKHHKKHLSLLFLNKKGFAQIILCGKCDQRLICKNCSVGMVYYKSGYIVCHYCGLHYKLPEKCECGGDWKMFGIGMEKVAATVKKLFPQASVACVYGQMNKTKMNDIMQRIHDGEIDILVGTQVMAQGHHIPNLNLVIMLDADFSLMLTHYRAIEQSYQLIKQLRGRCGREQLPGKFLIQTHFPKHMLFQILNQHDCKGKNDRADDDKLCDISDGANSGCSAKTEICEEISDNNQIEQAFIQTELKSRKKYHWPPYWKLCAVIISCKAAEKHANDRGTHYTDQHCMETIKKFIYDLSLECLKPFAHVFSDLKHTSQQHTSKPIASKQFAASDMKDDIPYYIYGPVQAPLYKLNNTYRYRILFKYQERKDLEAFVSSLKAFIEAYKDNKKHTHGGKCQINIQIDIDPEDFN